MSNDHYHSWLVRPVVEGTFALPGTERRQVYVDTSGCVGVGTTNPREKLDVSGNLVVGGNQIYFSHDGSTDSNNNYISYTDSRHMGCEGVVSLHADSSRSQTWSSPSAGLSAKAGYFRENLGVGTNSPSSALHVNGNARIEDDLTVGNNLTVETDLTVADRVEVRGDLFAQRRLSVTDSLSVAGSEYYTSGNEYRFRLESVDVDIASPRRSFAVGYDWTWHSSSGYSLQFRINNRGDLYCRGSKAGYITDYFVNRSGDKVSVGDLVVISKEDVTLFSGFGNNIPIPEVDLTSKAYDSRVFGIVVRAVRREDLPEVQPDFSSVSKDRAAQDRVEHPFEKLASSKTDEGDLNSVESGQIGMMVTLGAFSHCKVDADIAPIQPGDLLTTSPTNGHAQKVLDKSEAIGAIVGKALGSLEKGKGKIPVMVFIQ